ncbi:MAG: hypothetical protein L0J35_00085 [Tetragenococcus halophilus]|nr:hypothetical protein [Tetragenococcus halophilus]
MELFKLFGSVLIDDKDAINSLNKVDKKGKTTGQKFAAVAKKGAMIGAAVVGATAAAGGALLGMASKTAETTDRIDKMSQKIGLSREGFQEWDFIMSQSGMSVDQLQTGFKTLVTQVDQAVQGTGKGAESFKKLGVSVKDANGNVKDQETIFNESVVALQGMKDGTEKAKLANDLFGRSGAEMMPLLNGAAGSVDEMKQKAHDLGLVLDDETIDSGVVFTDTMDQVKRSMGALVTNVGADVMPMFQTLLEWFIANMPTIQSVAGVVFGAISTVVSTLADIFVNHILPSLQILYDFIVANMPTIQSVTTTAIDIVKAAFDAFGDAIKWASDNLNIIIPIVVGFASAMALMTIIGTVKKLIDAWKASTIIQTIAQGGLNAVLMANPMMWIVGLIGALIAAGVALYMNWDKVKAFAKSLWSSMKSIFGNIKNAVVGAFTGMMTAASEKMSSIWNTAKRIFGNVYTAIMNPVNKAKDAVKNAIDKIKGFFNFNFKWPKLKMPKFGISGSMNPVTWLKNGVPKLTVRWNAKGGIFDKPTIFNTAQGLQGVGEAGPEAIMPLSKLESMLNLNNEKKGNEVTVNVNIDTFNNESDKDINELAEKLAFETNRRLSGGGLGYV